MTLRDHGKMASLGLDKLLVWAQRLLQVDGSLFCGDIGADIIQNVCIHGCTYNRETSDCLFVDF